MPPSELDQGFRAVMMCLLHDSVNVFQLDFEECLHVTRYIDVCGLTNYCTRDTSASVYPRTPL